MIKKPLTLNDRGTSTHSLGREEGEVGVWYTVKKYWLPLTDEDHYSGDLVGHIHVQSIW